MGHFKHSTLIITSWHEESIKSLHKKANEIFHDVFEKDLITEKGEDLITPIFEGIRNEQYTFFIIPDGSKEGWAASDLSDEARKKLIDYIDTNDFYCSFAELFFGGDDDTFEITGTRSQ